MITRTGMINYDQPFYVDVAMKKGGLATAVLFQGEGKYKRALGWYSTYLQGLDDWTDCEKSLKAVFWAYHKVSKLTLRGRVDIRSTHEVMGIIEQARFNLSVGRRMRYLELLEKHNLTVRIIKTKNEANRLLFCDEGEPHCCEDKGIRDMKIRPDLKCDLMEGTRTLFVDGSCGKNEKGVSEMGYGIAEWMDGQLEELRGIKIENGIMSAQRAETMALTEACRILEGEKGTIFTDSAYGFGIHCLKINTNKSEVITHEAKNLFESPEEEALGHCISKDCALRAGIALEFRNRYGVE